MDIVYKFGQKCEVILNHPINEMYRCWISPELKVSIVRGPFTYGGDKGLWEMGLMDKYGELIYDKFYEIFGGDVVGFLNENEVAEIIKDLKEKLQGQ